jgi:hypothetical protein
MLSVGTVAGDTLHEFHRVVTPFLDSRGRLVVPLSNSSTLRVFGPDGEFLMSHGRAGAGPGEFEHISAAWARGDTIEVFDGSLNRITRFYPDDQFEVVDMERAVGVQGAVPGAAPDGWILHRVAPGGERASVSEATRRDDLVLHHFALDGSHLGEITRTEGIARFRSPVGNGPDPLSPRSVMIVSNGLLYVGETLTPALRVLQADGTPHSEIRWDARQPQSIDRLVSDVMDSAVARSPAGHADGTRARLQAAPPVDAVSAWWDFIVDSEGFIWVRQYDPLRHAAALGGLGTSSYTLGGNGHGGTWSIVSPDGGMLNEVELPLELSPVQINADVLVGIRRDALGVESVQVHRLSRR